MLEKETGWVCGRDFGFCYNPEFIALGNVIRGLLEPDLVLIGESDEASGAALEGMYRKYLRNQPRIARMSVISAELTKISVNSFITMKISFTNQLRMIAEQFPKANIHTILEAIGARQGARAESIAREHALLARRVLDAALSDQNALSRVPGGRLINLSAR